MALLLALNRYLIKQMLSLALAKLTFQMTRTLRGNRGGFGGIWRNLGEFGGMPHLLQTWGHSFVLEAVMDSVWTLERRLSGTPHHVRRGG